MRKNVLEQADALGIVVAVGKALVDGETQLYAISHGVAAIVVIERTLFHLADDDEQRGGTPVVEVVVAALELDGAEVERMTEA